MTPKDFQEIIVELKKTQPETANKIEALLLEIEQTAKKAKNSPKPETSEYATKLEQIKNELDNLCFDFSPDSIYLSKNLSQSDLQTIQSKLKQAKTQLQKLRS